MAAPTAPRPRVRRSRCALRAVRACGSSQVDGATLSIARSTRGLLGPYETVQDLRHVAPGQWAEAPSVVHLGERRPDGSAAGGVVLYTDLYPHGTTTVGKYAAYSAPSMAGPWTDITPSVVFPPGLRHATVLRAPSALVESLRTRSEGGRRRRRGGERRQHALVPARRAMD